MSEAESFTPDVRQILLISHPRYQAEAEAYKEALDGWMDVRLEESKPEGWEPNAEHIGKLIGQDMGVAIGVIGGDGTFNDIATGLIRNAELAKRASITPVCGGNAYDVRRGVHGRWPMSPRKLFSRGIRGVEVHGLEFTIEDEAGEVTASEIAISYGGIGESALASGRVNSDKYQNGRRLIRDAKIVGGTLLSNYELSIQSGDENPKLLRTIEFNKGPAEAKLGVIPVQYRDPEYHINHVEARFAAGCRSMAGLLIGHGGGYNTSEPYQFTVESTADNRPAPFHMDGDVYPGGIAIGSAVTVGLTENTYTLLSR